MWHLLASSLSSSGPERGRIAFVNSSQWKQVVRNGGQVAVIAGKIWHRCVSLPVLCPAKICTMKFGKFFAACTSLTIIYPPMVVWKRWGQPHVRKTDAPLFASYPTLHKINFCHLSDSLARFLNFQCTFEAHPTLG